MVNTKHTVNDPKGDIGTSHPRQSAFRRKFFKNERIQDIWPDFQNRNIITGRNIEDGFKPKYRQKMMEPVRALGWSALIPLPTSVTLICFRNQHDQHIDEGFSNYTISRGISVDSTDKEDDIEIPPQILGDINMDDVSLDDDLAQSPHPQEGQTSREGPPDWFIEYFGQMRTTMERIEQTQKENFDYMKARMDSIEQRQILNDKLHELHGTYIDRLGDNYEQLYTQQTELHQECLDRLKAVQTIVEAESHFQYDPPPFSPHSQALMNLKGTKRSNSF
ncbi:hypothetical protein Acr_27g0002180 [Actinidia rufa]|uniref:Uncharacterized protein n=1 Tax=Actinidia rufa TaxID=165716 RepID=A0A7J0H5Z9_9ERIC|nr:hypothetical protein Acr_27g0002180 [Actinidia rufa]